MQKYFFWLKWDKPYRILTSILFILLITLILSTIVLISIGHDGLIGWHTYSQKMAVNVVMQTVNVGPFSFPFDEQLYVIKEFVAGGSMPNTVVAKQFALFLTFGLLALILALFTYFNRWGFLVFSGFVFFFIIFLHPEMLRLSSLSDGWILGGVFFIFIGPAYYFQAYNKNASFILRVISMLLATWGFLALVIWQSDMPSPYNALYSYGILAPYLVVILFVLMVGHEVVNGFAMAIAGSKEEEGNNRLNHFMAISFIYLLNVLLSYLQITHVISWNFMTVNPIILLGLASILGVWGIGKRFVLYKKVSDSQQVWVLFYLALAILAFTTITYFLYSLEDPFIKIISDFIVFTQLAFGTAFFIYIIYNFISIIEQGHSLKDILYKPQNLPHVTYRLVGVVILTALVLMRDIKYPIWYSLGGYYNSIAGYFEDQGDNELASIFYEKGADLSKKNHKSNYKLGMITIDSDKDKSIEYFDVASSRLPTPQAFVNKANLESDKRNYFEALFTLQSGIVKIPNSIEIENNLGLQFSKSNVLDSAWYYLSEARGLHAAQNNALAFVLENNFSISATDSSLLFSNLDNSGKANAAALGVVPNDLSKLDGNNMMSAVQLINALSNQSIPFDSSSYNSIISIIDSTTNDLSSEQLNYALAMYEFRNEYVSKAVDRLQNLTALGSDSQAKYFETLGIINLYYESYDEASINFYLATEGKQLGHKSFLTPLALAQSEGGYFNEALTTWYLIEQQGTKKEADKASIMINVLNSIINQNDSIIGGDIGLYLKARYQKLWVDEYAVKATLDLIEDVSIRNELALELAKYYFSAGNVVSTKLFYDLIDPSINSTIIMQPLLEFNIRLAYAGSLPDLDTQIQNYYKAGFQFSNDEQLEKVFFETNRAEINEDFAERLGNQNPFFAEGVVWAASYFTNDSDEYKSYNLLQEALGKNPNDRLLLEAYILKAVDVGMDRYATNSLQHYRELFPGDTYYNFDRKVADKRSDIINDWENEE